MRNAVPVASLTFRGSVALWHDLVMTARHLPVAPLGRRVSLARVLPAVPALVGERGDEPIAPARDGRDEARMPVVVLELDPQASDVAIHDVALGHEVGAPDTSQDLVPGDHPSASTGEEIEQALLDAAQVDDRLTGPHLPVHDVDLHLAELDRRDDRPIGARRASGDDDGPGEQLLGREGHREDVVDPQVECPQLRLEVAASSQSQGRRHALRQAVRGAEMLEQRGAVVVVHVDHGDVGRHSARRASASARVLAARTTKRPWFRVSRMRSRPAGGRGAPVLGAPRPCLRSIDQPSRLIPFARFRSARRTPRHGASAGWRCTSTAPIP